MNQLTSILLFFLAFLPQALFSQSSTLTIEQIMEGEDFVGHSPSGIQWGMDGAHVYFDWQPSPEATEGLYRVAANGGEPVRIPLKEEKEQLFADGVWNEARTKMLFTRDGDIFLADVATKEVLQVTNTVDRESDAVFSGDEKQIVYLQGDNLFTWELETGQVAQLTDYRSGSEPKDKALSPSEKWLEDDQLTFFEVLKQREDNRKNREERQELTAPERPLKIYLGKKRVFRQQLSPDGRFVTYLLTSPANDKNTMVPDFVTKSGYVEELNARAKVGSPQDTYEMGIYDLERDTAYLIDPAQIPGIYDKPAFLEEYHEGEGAYEPQYEKPREVIINGPVYNEKGDKAAVVVRSQDNKDRWIMRLDLPTGKLSLVDRQRDEAWVGGPGISNYNFALGNIGWMADGKTLWFQSEETGFSHLYTYDTDKNTKKALTSGDWEVLDAFLSQDKKTFYLTTNEVHPGEQHFYRMAAKGGDRTQLTQLPGNHEVSLSPDERTLAIRYSYSNKPWELYLQPLDGKKEMRQITDSQTAAFKGYSWREPELVSFKASDGVEVPARLYRPANPTPGGKAVIFVHGAGYLQNVHKWWSSYYREYMFHNFLADHGYTVMDIDYRGSAGYGRDWRTAIYRHMGGKDLSDQVDGAKFLVEEYGIGSERIGMYGGSYGGFITLMAMFTSPGTFKAGAALRSVTDWAHYNHGYTSNILNTPAEDSLAYYRSSPIYHAENLQDHLLIMHGMVDTNVQFQDVVRLAQRLIELGKDDWEFAVFPVEGHGFVEPSSWADEYKRIFKLFEEQL